MAAPTAQISAISSYNPAGTPAGVITTTETRVGVSRKSLLSYAFSAGIIVFIAVFAATWILLISFTPSFILVDDPNVRGTKMISYGSAVVWSIIISLIVTFILSALVAGSAWF